MKLKFTLMLFLSFLSSTLLGQQSELTLQSVVQDIYNKAKVYSVYRKNVNWDSLHEKIFSSPIRTESNLEEKVKLIFETLGDKHAMLLFKGKRIVHSTMPDFVLRLGLKDALSNGPVSFRTTLLEDGYAYILLPSGSKHDSQTLQLYQDQLCALNLANLKGIVFDLRLNEGGSVYPLAAFGQLYGADYIGYNSTLMGNLSSKWKVKNGTYYQNNSPVATVKNKCASNHQLKIAVLISQLTASSGEIFATAFKGRPNTIFIGEQTYGLTTLNAEFNLGYSYYLGISSAFIADRDGKVYYDHISPDIEMIAGDNFSDLNQDLKVKAALEWLKK